MKQAHLMTIDQRLPPFFDGMRYYVQVSRKARESLASKIADTFSVFDYIQPNENRLSIIIADLLRPKGSHGQGSAFLRSFLKCLTEWGCELPKTCWDLLDDAKVITESATTFLFDRSRRIDILIELSRDYGIGIENKPWAVEQAAQLADYRTHLKRRFVGGYILLFLTQQGRTPTSISDAELAELRNSGTQPFSVIQANS